MRERRGHSPGAVDGRSPAPEEYDVGEDRRHGLKGDYGSLALLLVLYTLQGVPMGLADSVSLLLREKHVSYKNQGVFSFVSWPFSLKILWAPVVDSIFIRSVGLRRTWLIPVQAAVGVALSALSWRVESILQDTENGPDVYMLTYIFFALYLLMATQDVAVDGWALTLLSRRNVGLASTANAVGQTVGYFAAFSGFMALQSHGLVTLGSYMRIWGGVFLFSCLLVIFKREKPAVAEESVGSVYRSAWALLRLPAVRTLAVVLFTCRVAFSPADAMLAPKLVEMGLPKAHLAYISTLIAPLHIVLPLVVAQWTSGDTPWNAFLASYPYRLLLGLVAAALVAFAPDITGGHAPYWFLAALTAFMCVQAVVSQAMFVAQMAFFARVADPAIGGTAMTLFNTIANLGGKWPGTLVFFLADWVSVRRCQPPAGSSSPLPDSVRGGAGGGAGRGAECSSAALEKACAKAGGSCVTIVDAFYPLTVAATVVGVIWIYQMRGSLKGVQKLSLASWHVSGRHRRDV